MYTLAWNTVRVAAPSIGTAAEYHNLPHPCDPIVQLVPVSSNCKVQIQGGDVLPTNRVSRALRA